VLARFAPAADGFSATIPKEFPMKTGRSITELAAELERQSKTKRDFVCDTRRLSVKATDSGLVLRGVTAEMPLRPTAHQQLASALAIPKPYYDRMVTEAPDLLATNANHWLGTQPAKKLVRTLDGQVRAFLSDKYRPLDNLDLAEAVLPQLVKLNAQVVSGEVTENRFYLKAVTEKVSGAVKVGDVIQAGVVVSNSEVGHGSLRVEELDYRLVCLNGMIRDTAVRKAHLGRGARGHDAIEDAREFFKDETRRADDRAFFLKVRDAVTGMFDANRFNARLDQYREAGKRTIDADPVEVVEVTSKRLGLTEDERTSVLQHLIRGGDLSAWGLANAVTRASQDVDSYDRCTELEALGGDIIELSTSEWKSIAA
jgi:hypothetical protein